jgi:hypothetical protein
LHDQLLRFELSRDVSKFSLVAARERGLGREKESQRDKLEMKKKRDCSPSELFLWGGRELGRIVLEQIHMVALRVAVAPS